MFVITLLSIVNINDKCKMCGCDDDGMNNSTYNWVSHITHLVFINTAGAM